MNLKMNQETNYENIFEFHTLPKESVRYSTPYVIQRVI